MYIYTNPAEKFLINDLDIRASKLFEKTLISAANDCFFDISESIEDAKAELEYFTNEISKSLDLYDNDYQELLVLNAQAQNKTELIQVVNSRFSALVSQMRAINDAISESKELKLQIIAAEELTQN